MLLLCISDLCLFLTERVRWTSWMCQKAPIQRSSQPRSNDPCVDPCVVSRLTLPLFPVLDNQSIVCLSVSLPLFRSFPLIWFSFSLVCIFLFPSLSFEPNFKLHSLHLSPAGMLTEHILVWSKLASTFHQSTVWHITPRRFFQEKNVLFRPGSWVTDYAAPRSSSAQYRDFASTSVT